MTYQPIERRKVYELIAEQLLSEISARRLQPGDVIPPERELTRVYRVGRSSVREALRMLESRGVIEDVGERLVRRRGLREPARQLAAAAADPRPGDDARHLRVAADPRMRSGGAGRRAARRGPPRADGRSDRRDDARPCRDRPRARRPLHRRRPPLPPRDRRGDAERPDHPLDARAARPDPPCADLDLHDPREPGALARAAPGDPRRDRRR